MIGFLLQIQNYALWLLGLMIIIQCLIIGLDTLHFKDHRKEAVFVGCTMLALILAAFSFKFVFGTFVAAVVALVGFLRLQYLLVTSRVSSYRIIFHLFIFVVILVIASMITRTILVEQAISKIAQ